MRRWAWLMQVWLDSFTLQLCSWMSFVGLWLQRAHCAICTDRIWGLGRQGYKCINCKLLVHKKCHKLVNIECGRHTLQPVSKTWLIVWKKAATNQSNSPPHVILLVFKLQPANNCITWNIIFMVTMTFARKFVIHRAKLQFIARQESNLHIWHYFPCHI